MLVAWGVGGSILRLQTVDPGVGPPFHTLDVTVPVGDNNVKEYRGRDGGEYGSYY